MCEYDTHQVAPLVYTVPASVTHQVASLVHTVPESTTHQMAHGFPHIPEWLLGSDYLLYVIHSLTLRIAETAPS